MTESIGIEQFILQSDFVIRTVALVLLTLSVVSWWIISARLVAQLRITRCVDRGKLFQLFWSATSISNALASIRSSDRSGVFSGLAETSIAVTHSLEGPRDGGIGGGVSDSEMLTRAMRNYIQQAQAEIETGQTFLASVGSTSPFIGLFGTVWGIYHALTGLAGASHVILDKVAGPVGEALIMTAAGLFVAIPAVIAYNAINRANRLILAQLDAFAHDLHAYLMTGRRVNTLQGRN